MKPKDPKIYDGEKPIKTTQTLPERDVRGYRRSVWVRRAALLGPSNEWSVYGPVSNSSSVTRITTALGEEFAHVEVEVRRVKGVQYAYLRVPRETTQDAETPAKYRRGPTPDMECRYVGCGKKFASSQQRARHHSLDHDASEKAHDRVT